MHSIRLMMTALTVMMLQSCGDSSFSGSAKQNVPSKGTSDQSDADSDAGDHDVDTSADSDADTAADEISELDLAETPDGDVIGKCLAEWGKHPFKKQDLAEHRTLEVSASMLGRSELQDLESSDQPEIVVVKVQSSTLGAANITLMNPRGWYCLDMGAQSLGSTAVTLHCKARIGNQSTSSGGLGNASLKKTCG